MKLSPLYENFYKKVIEISIHQAGLNRERRNKEYALKASPGSLKKKTSQKEV